MARSARTEEKSHQEELDQLTFDLQMRKRAVAHLQIKKKREEKNPVAQKAELQIKKCPVSERSNIDDGLINLSSSFKHLI